MSIKARHKSVPAQAKHWTEKLRAVSDLRLSFNLSFIANDDHYNLNNDSLNHQALMRKMEQLSNRTLVSMLNEPKKAGIENIPQKKLNGRIKDMPIPVGFGETRSKIATDKLAIARFNSQQSRLIGKLIDQTFYIFWIDCNHELYKG